MHAFKRSVTHGSLCLADAGENAESPPSEIKLAQEMQSAGYRTCMVGKWHLGYPTPAHIQHLAEDLLCSDFL